MPAGTLYAKCAPWVFESVCIKGDTLYSEGKPIDWFYQQIGADAIKAHDSGEWGNKLDDALANGTSVSMDFYCEGRDGCFEDDQIFAVFEPQDVKDLISRLERCV